MSALNRPSQGEFRRAEAALAPDPPPSDKPPGIVARNWRAIGKSTLVGSANIIVVKWHLVIKGVCLHQKGDKRWIGLPSKEWIDKDGKRQFSDTFGFIDHETDRRFREAALAAIIVAAEGGGP